jgi:hypothetical protein
VGMRIDKSITTKSQKHEGKRVKEEIGEEKINIGDYGMRIRRRIIHQGYKVSRSEKVKDREMEADGSEAPEVQMEK